MTRLSIKEKILKDRGLSSFQPSPGKHKKLRRMAPSAIPDNLKTPKMLYLELKHKKPIEVILVAGSLSAIARMLDNEVDTSTISKWKKRFGLNQSEEELDG